MRSQTTIKIILLFVITVFYGCSDDSTSESLNRTNGTENSSDSEDTGHAGSTNDEEAPSEVDKNGKCVDKTIKDEPGVCGCQFEDKDINDDGVIDCPVRTIPKNALPVLEEIPDKCAEWDYPKHHIIEYPKLPEYGYEITIDTEKYKISKVYDESKATETTKGLNQAIKDYKEAGYTRIVIPHGHYPIALNSGGGLTPTNDIAIIMSDDVILQMIPIDRYDCKPIYISGKENIYIEGGTVIGDKYTHLGPKTQEECGGVYISASGHVFINKMTIKDVHGDGILILDKTAKDKVSKGTDVIIANCDIEGAYRNGIAVVGSDGIRISNNHIHHTEGTAPQFGIDFEYTSSTRKNLRPIVDHNTFNDNVGGDLIIDSHNTFIEYNTFDMGEMEKYVDGPFFPRAKKSSFIFYRNKVLKSKTVLFNSYNFTKNVVPTEAEQPNPSFFVENEIHTPARVQLNYRYQICIKDNLLDNGAFFYLHNINKLRLYDNTIHTYAKVANSYVLRDTITGKAGGNRVCKHDEENNVTCTELTKLNEMNDEENYKYP